MRTEDRSKARDKGGRWGEEGDELELHVELKKS